VDYSIIWQNVYKALHDIPALTELCVLILYSISISVPYMGVVRGPQHHTTNVLNLGPLHDKVKAHCQAIINNPDLLLAPDASYECGSMDGIIWDQPEVFYAVHQLIPSFPILKMLLKNSLKVLQENGSSFHQNLFLISAHKHS
jgi:hypothetical protein